MNQEISIEEICGLNHSSEHLTEVRFLIPFWDRKKQARYADEVCKESIQDEEFIKDQMNSITNTNDIEMFRNFNTTSVGNLALLSLLAPPPYSKKSEEILLNYIEYVRTLKQ
jgi:hypothetical protein